MTSQRKIALAVGVLYIMGTAFGIASVAFIMPALTAPSFLEAVSVNQGSVRLGAFCVLLMGLSLAIIPILMYPVIGERNKTMAVGYVVFRGALETATYFVTVAGFLLLLTVSDQLRADSADIGYLTTLGNVCKSLTDMPLTAIAFSVGAIILYLALFRYRLVPRWLSGFGLIAIILHFVTGILIWFGLQDAQSVWNTAMNFPIFIQEMIMAVWLIVKGFEPDPSEAPSGA